MTDKRTSQLTAATSLATTDYFPVVQAGLTKRATFDLLPFVQSGSGASSRTMQAKAREQSSIADFGTTYVYDNFDRPDRTINGDLCPTGQAWALNGAGIATTGITSGRLTGASNTYCTLDYGGTLTETGGSFSFVSGSGTNVRSTSVLTLIADSAQNGLQTMLHMIISPNGWTLQKRLAGGAFTGILSGTHFLQCDGSVYQASYSISGNTVTVCPPDGKRVSVTDADVSTIATRYGTWQIAPDANGFIGKWHSVQMGPRPPDGRVGLGVAAPMGPVTFLHGAGMHGLTGLRGVVLSGGAGWYRIATVGTFATLVLAGKVKVSFSDSLRAGGFEISLSTQFNDTTPILSQEFCHCTTNGMSISQVRLSTDSAGLAAGLDINVPNAQAVTINVDFLGPFVQVEAPVVGATVLATGATTMTLAPKVKQGVFAPVRIAPTYGASVAINASLANSFEVTATNGTAFTVANPTSFVGAADGEIINITIRNTSGGALGVVTWDTLYKLAAFTNPATGFSRSVTFRYNSSVWVEIGRTTVDVPN